MIAGGTRGNGGRYLADHLTNGEHNESVTLSGSRGLVNDGSVHGALRELRIAGRTLRTDRPVHHLHANPAPDEPDWTSEQWDRYWSEYEREFRLTGAPFFEVTHKKRGEHPGMREHRHRVYLARGDDGRVVDFSHDRARREKVSRIAEFEVGAPFTKGAHNKAVHAALIRDGRADIADAMSAAGLLDGPRPVAMSPEERQQQARAGVLKKDVNAAAWLAWSLSNDAHGFSDALRRQGYGVAVGEKTLLLVDRTGNLHRLPQAVASGAKVAGQGAVKVADVRARLAGLDLPTVAGSKADAVTLRRLFDDVDLALEADLGRPVVDPTDAALEIDLAAAATPEHLEAHAHADRQLRRRDRAARVRTAARPAAGQDSNPSRGDRPDRQPDGSPDVVVGTQAGGAEPGRGDPRPARPSDPSRRGNDDRTRGDPGGPNAHRRGDRRPGETDAASSRGRHQVRGQPGATDRAADRGGRAAASAGQHRPRPETRPGASAVGAAQQTGRITGGIRGPAGTTRAALPPVDDCQQRRGQSVGRRRWIAGLAYGDRIPDGLIDVAEAMWTTGEPAGALKARLAGGLGDLTDDGQSITWQTGHGVASDDRRAISAILDAAASRGWTSVMLTGDEAFVRAAGLECARRGIGVSNSDPELQALISAERARLEEGRRQTPEPEREDARGYNTARADVPAAPRFNDARGRHGPNQGQNGAEQQPDDAPADERAAVLDQVIDVLVRPLPPGSLRRLAADHVALSAGADNVRDLLPTLPEGERAEMRQAADEAAALEAIRDAGSGAAPWDAVGAAAARLTPGARVRVAAHLVLSPERFPPSAAAAWDAACGDVAPDSPRPIDAARARLAGMIPRDRYTLDAVLGREGQHQAAPDEPAPAPLPALTPPRPGEYRHQDDSKKGRK